MVKIVKHDSYMAAIRCYSLLLAASCRYALLLGAIIGMRGKGSSRVRDPPLLCLAFWWFPELAIASGQSQLESRELSPRISPGILVHVFSQSQLESSAGICWHMLACVSTYIFWHMLACISTC